MNRVLQTFLIVAGTLGMSRLTALEIGTRDVRVLRIGVVDMDRVMERAPAARRLQEECRTEEQRLRAALDASREELRRLAAQRISVQAAIDGYRAMLSSAASPPSSAVPSSPAAGGRVVHTTGSVAVPPPPPPTIVVPAPSVDPQRAEWEDRLARTRAMIAELDRNIGERNLQLSTSRGRSDTVRIQQELQEFQRRKADAEREVSELEGKLSMHGSSAPVDRRAFSTPSVDAEPDRPALSADEIAARIATAQQELSDLTARIESLSRTIADREAQIAGEVAEFRQRRECEIIAELYDAVKMVAAREGLNVVIEKSGILYGVPEVDITDQVIRQVLK